MVDVCLTLSDPHSLPDVAWPAARSAALWAFCRRQNSFAEANRARSIAI